MNLGASTTYPAPRHSLGAVRWDRLTCGIGLSFALLSWSLSYGSVLPQLRDDLHLSASTAAMHGSVFGVCLLVLSVLGSRCLAALPNGLALRLCALFMVGGGVLFGFGHSVAFTLGGAVLTGTGAALFIIVVPGIVYAHQPQAPTQTMSTLNAFPMVSSTLLPLSVAGAAAIAISWRVAYLGPVLALGAVIAFTTAKAPVPPSPVENPVRIADLVRVPHLWRRWSVLVFATLAEVGTVTWGASIMRDLGGAAKGTAASLTVGFFIAMFFGRLALAQVLLRFNGQVVLRMAFIGSIMFFIPFLVGPSLIVRMLGLTGLGVCLSPAYPLSLTRLFELHNDTAALGRLSAMASGIGITFGPMLLGVLSDSVGLGWATAVLPVFALCGLLTVALPQRKQPQPLVA